jgi:hypothetical protein
MAIEAWLTGTAVVVSALTPVIYLGALKMKPLTAFIASVATAMVVSEIVFRSIKPDFHYGPLYGVAIVMNLFLASMAAGFVNAVLSQMLKR